MFPRRAHLYTPFRGCVRSPREKKKQRSSVSVCKRQNAPQGVLRFEFQLCWKLKCLSALLRRRALKRQNPLIRFYAFRLPTISEWWLKTQKTLINDSRAFHAILKSNLYPCFGFSEKEGYCPFEDTATLVNLQQHFSNSTPTAKVNSEDALSPCGHRFAVWEVSMAMESDSEALTVMRPWSESSHLYRTQ